MLRSLKKPKGKNFWREARQGKSLRAAAAYGRQLKINNLNETKVKLYFKNCQNKNQLGFKNQLDQISYNSHQDKTNLTLRTKMAVTKNVLTAKFDCFKKIYY